ncbi:hypothetical protein ACVMGC_004271 [Bradyrhizobium barranii subsp. barranii]
MSSPGVLGRLLRIASSDKAVSWEGCKSAAFRAKIRVDYSGELVSHDHDLLPARRRARCSRGPASRRQALHRSFKSRPRVNASVRAQATVDVEQILQAKCAGGRHSTADFAAQPPRGNQRDHAVVSKKTEVEVRPNEELLSDDAGKSSTRAADICAAQNRANLAGAAGASYGPITSPIPELSGRAPCV